MCDKVFQVILLFNQELGLILYQIITISILLTYIILLLQDDFFDENFKYCNIIIDNWKLKPILDLRLTTNNCYEDELNFTQYNWPGVQRGCYCKETEDRNYPIFLNSNCTVTLQAVGCKSFIGNAQEQFTKFPDPLESKSFSICAKFDNHTFFDNAPLSNKCNENEQKCGTEENTFFCSNTSQCPLTEIHLNGDNKNLSLNENQYLSFKNNNTQLPIVRGLISEGDGVCLDPSQRHITSGRQDYAGMNEKKVECILSQNSYEIYKVTEGKFYESNEYLSDIKSIPGFEIDDQYEWGLFYQTYILWKMECRGTLMDKFKKLHNYESLLSSFQTAQIMGYVNLGLFGGVFSLIYISIGKDFFDNFQYVKYSKIFLIEQLCQTYEIILIGVTLNLKQKLNDAQDTLNQIINNQCTDQFFIDLLSLIKRNEDIIDYIDIACYCLLSFYLLGLCSAILIIIIKFRYKIKYYLINFGESLSRIKQKFRERLQNRRVRIQQQRQKKLNQIRQKNEHHEYHFDKDQELMRQAPLAININLQKSLQRSNTHNSNFEELKVPDEGGNRGKVLINEFEMNPLKNNHSHSNE